MLSVLQNVDALYWKATEEQQERVEAVRVSDDVVCVFNSTPLEKYESYRLFLDQWSRCDDSPDFAPTFYNLIDSLARFLEINRYSPHNGTQPKFLVDLLPEVYGGPSDAMLRRSLSRNSMDEDRESLMSMVEQRGSAYLPQVNAFFVREFQMIHAAEDATRFLHQACQGLPRRQNSDANQGSDGNASHGCKTAVDQFYARVIEHTVAYFGSRVLCPSRSAPDDLSPISRAECEKAAQAAIRTDKFKSHSVARELGYRIGNQIYDAYLAGKVKPSGLRRLFLAHLDEPGLARKVCTAVIAKLRSTTRPLARPAHV